MWCSVVLLLAALCCPGGGFLVPNARDIPKNRRCISLRTHGMHAADCQRLDLTDIPQNLNKDIEVLDVTFNRIRELYNTSFVNYPYIRLLYLEDNSISFIEAAAFEPLQDLEVLNLAVNSLHQLPDAIHSLPVLRKLLLQKNPFHSGSVEFNYPLRSVEHLDISDCRLTEVPVLDALPRLISLNVSNNKIKNINVQQLAPMCRLQTLYLHGNKNVFKGDTGRCDCVVLGKWAEMRHIRLLPDLGALCPNQITFDNSTCFDNKTDTLFKDSGEITRSCEAQVLEYGSGPIRFRGSMLWTIGILTACAVLLVCFGSVYFVRRRQRQFHQDDVSEVESITKSRS